MTKDTWGPPPSGGWPQFCKCGKRRRWVDVWDEEVGAHILDDQHSCKEEAA